MKKFKLMAILLVSLLIFAGCGSDSDITNPDDGLDPGAEGLVVTGNFTNESSELQSSSNVKAANNTEVGSVVLIDKSGYEVINIENNEFALEMDRESPSAIAFVDKNENYLGYLTLAEGMGSFPTQAVDEETNTIDLGEIDFTGDEAIPEYNPMGSEIEISKSDLNTLTVSDSFFSAVATSPDLIDLLIKEDQRVGVGVSYFGSHNNFDENGETYLNETDLNLKTHRIAVHFSNPLTDTFQDLSLTYPDSTNVGVNNKLVEDKEATADWVNFPGVGDKDRVNEEKGGAVGTAVPEAGEYIVDNNADLRFSFYIPELQAAAEEHLIVPLPKIELYENEEGKKMIDSISWEYYTNSGEHIDNPEYILNYIGVQLSADPEKLDQLIGDYSLTDGDTRIFDKYNRDVTNQSVDLREQEIYWEDLSVVDMAYNDLYGIHYLVPFAHPDYN